MHLLFISSLLPAGDPQTGFEIANRAVIGEMRKAGVRLTVAGFQRPGGRPAGEGEISLGELEIENAGASRAQKLRWVARALARNLPVAAAKLAVLSRRELIARLAEAGPVDGLVLNSIQMPTAYPFLADALPSIFIAHNVEHVSAAGNARNAADPLQRLLYAREARLLRRSEAALCRKAGLVFTFSAEDRAALGLAAAPQAVPLALSIGRPARPAEDGERTHDIGLIGTWSWAPNRVGLDWFVREVAPLLPGDVTVSIAGRFDGSPPSAPANVRFLGRVPDAQRFVRSSRVIALATKGGTGVQLKTIETFEEGLPAVATPSALRGVGEPPPNVRVADEPAAFAAALLDLVLAERSGRLARSGGHSFAARQADALRAGMAEGLRLFRARLAGPGAGEDARSVDAPLLGLRFARGGAATR